MSHNEAPTRQVRPLVLFTGETNYCYWIDHFENVTVVNGWDKAAKLPLQGSQAAFTSKAWPAPSVC